MNKPAIDWHYLGHDLKWPGLSAAAMAIVLAATLMFHGAQQAAYATYTVNQDAVHDSYDALIQRRRILERYHYRYDDYRSSGFVGHESRLEWADTIRAAVSQLDVPQVSYTLEPQLEVIAPVASNHVDPNLKIYASRIALEIGIVHELDFLRFFEKLRAEIPGILKVDRCNMSRTGDAGGKATTDVNISVDCALMLYSVITSDTDAAGAGA